MASHYLSVEQVDMTFVTKGATTNVLKEIDLGVAKGEYISIIGHSGCGKSTLLNIIAAWCFKTTRYCPGSPSTKTSRWR